MHLDEPFEVTPEMREQMAFVMATAAAMESTVHCSCRQLVSLGWNAEKIIALYAVELALDPELPESKRWAQEHWRNRLMEKIPGWITTPLTMEN